MTDAEVIGHEGYFGQLGSHDDEHISELVAPSSHDAPPFPGDSA